MNEKIRIFLADDHKMLRESLIMLLSQEEDFEITGQAADGIQLCRSIYDIRGETDIVLMDQTFLTFLSVLFYVYMLNGIASLFNRLIF